MALKKFNPITPGQRGLVIVDRSNFRKVCIRRVVEITQGTSLHGIVGAATSASIV